MLNFVRDWQSYFYMMQKYISFTFYLLFITVGVMYGQNDTSEFGKNNKQLVDNFDLNEAVKMYPNPAGNFLIINSKIPVTKVQIFSLLGTKVKDIELDFRSIYLGELKSGIYMIKIYSGNISTTKKLIKK